MCDPNSKLDDVRRTRCFVQNEKRSLKLLGCLKSTILTVIPKVLKSIRIYKVKVIKL